MTTERNTFDWDTLEDSADVQIAKILADEAVTKLATDLGHPVAVNPDAPIRVMEAK